MFGRETPQQQERADAWARWLQQRNPFAIASLVLGIFSLIEMGVTLIFGVAGIVLGIIALRQLKQGKQPQGGRLARLGIALSVLSLIIAIVIYLLPLIKK